MLIVGFFATQLCSMHAHPKCYKAAAPIVILYKYPKMLNKTHAVNSAQSFWQE